MAERSLNERRLKPARAYLAGCPEPYRQWEWGRLQYLCNADLMTLKAGGQFVAFLPDGRRAVVASFDGTVSLHDFGTGAVGRTFIEKAGFGSAVALSADGKHVAVSGDDAVSVWAVDSGKQVFSYTDVKQPDTTWSHDMAFSADGARVAARTDKDAVKVWDVNANTELAAFEIGRNKGFTMAFSPDGATLLTGAAVFGAQGWENALTLRDSATGAVVSSHTIPAPGYLHELLFAPDGARVAVGTDTAVSVWNVDGWKKQAEFKAPIFYPNTLAFAPDGTRLAAGGKDGSLTVWDVANDKQIFSGKTHLDAVHNLAFSPDGARVATASFDRTARLWDTVSGAEIKRLRGHNAQVFCVAFNAAGTRLATGGYDGATKLWAVDSDLDAGPAQAMDLCAQRGYLAGSMGGALKLWDSRTGHVVRTFEASAGRVARVALDPDGRLFAAVTRAGDAPRRARVGRRHRQGAKGNRQPDSTT